MNGLSNSKDPIILAGHPSLPKDQLTWIVKYHDAFDSILSLHYSTHTKLLSAHELFRRAGDLLHKRTKIENLLCVLMAEPRCYKLLEPTGVDDYSPCYVTLFEPIAEFNLQLELRKRSFRSLLNNWIETHQDIGYFNIPEVPDVIQSHGKTKSASPSKVTKPRLALKNDASKFTFKERIEQKEREKTGLSLLERIKLKEKKALLEDKNEPPEVKRQKYLKGKLVQVYNIIYQLNGDANKVSTYPMTKLTHMIKDSLDYPIHKDEIVDCLKLLDEKLSNITISSRGQLSVVRVYELDRTKDIEILDK